MTSDVLTENEKKVLCLIHWCGGTISERTTREVLEWDEDVFAEVKNSLLKKELIHDLQHNELQFGKQGQREALKILVSQLFHTPPSTRKHFLSI